MNIRLVLFTLGNLLIFEAAAMLAPLAVAFFYRYTNGETDATAIGISVAVTFGAGLLIRFLTRTEDELRNKEGFAVVAFAWATIAFFGALPYLLYGVFDAPDRGLLTQIVFSYFESISGFTTTGATVLTNIEALPHGLLFWRSLTHWLGGMGIVVLAVAILPLLGVGGMQLYRAEAPGPQTDRLTPRIAQTAKLMWGVYVLISGIEVVLLWLGGMTPFDALAHTFGTMATGGFATKNASIGHYNSVYIDTVVTVFMLIAGTNFALHYRALRGDWKAYFRDEEFRFYIAMFFVALGLIVWNTMTRGPQTPAIIVEAGEASASVVLPAEDRATIEVSPGEKTVIQIPAGEARSIEVSVDETAEIDISVGEIVHAEQPVFESFGKAVRYGAFQVAAILTTTGYGTSDFELWPSLSQIILVGLMFFGGCAGSTGGGLKHVRMLLLIKHGYTEIKRLILPRAVLPIRINDRVIPPEVVRNILGVFSLFIGIVALASLALAAMGVDMVTSVTAVISAMGNIGPGLGTVGPVDNYAHIPTLGKVLLSFCMLLGRLELYTVLVLFAPQIWKK